MSTTENYFSDSDSDNRVISIPMPMPVELNEHETLEPERSFTFTTGEIIYPRLTRNVVVESQTPSPNVNIKKKIKKELDFSKLEVKKKLSNSYYDYRNKKNIVDCILQYNGVLFGGYVRDTILHDHYADIFYEYIDSKDLKSSYPKISNESYQRMVHNFYNDSTYHPESKLRLTVPKDIDCFFQHESDFNEFLRDIQTHKFIIKKNSGKFDPKQYFPRMNIESDEVDMYRITIGVKTIHEIINDSMYSQLPYYLAKEAITNIMRLITKMNFNVPDIHLDVFVAKPNKYNISPPFGNLDFYCNGIILTKYGYGLCDVITKNKLDTSSYNGNKVISRFKTPMQCLSEIEKIKREIIAKIARWVPDQNKINIAYRYAKMYIKQWKIIGDTFELGFLENQNEDEFPHECLICKEELESQKSFKLKCCSGMYDLECFTKAIQHNRNNNIIDEINCFHCRKVLDNNDLYILQKIQEIVNANKIEKRRLSHCNENHVFNA